MLQPAITVHVKAWRFGSPLVRHSIEASGQSTWVGSAVMSTPADVVKSRLMNQDPCRPTYRGMAHCFTATLRAEGWRGLYAGFLPTWARLGPWQLVFWTSYEGLRKAGGMAGF
jgi:solute carrier family 25 uncoupling protein 27